MNAEPGADELEPYEEIGLREAVSERGDVRTFRSWDPDEHIDHIFVGPGVSVDDLQVPRSEASDHLAVAVTLTLDD